MLNVARLTSYLLLCDALQTHMKHFQHLWDLKYKPYITDTDGLLIIQNRVSFPSLISI